MDDLKKIDIYELLDVNSDAPLDQIKKAYRKKALKCHPDKNPDDPKAADTFRKLSRALELLSDKSARAAYDKLWRARKEAKDRIKNLDSKRRKFKDDLEAREKSARDEQENKDRNEQKLAEEIERLRREGSKVVEEELDLLRQQIEEEIREIKLKNAQIKLPRLKCKWSKKTKVYDEKSLRDLFEPCGRISMLVVSSTNPTAVVEFETTDAAFKAIKLNSDNLQIKWVENKPNETTNDNFFRNFDNLSSVYSKQRIDRRKNEFFDYEFEKKVLDKLENAILKQKNKVQ